MTDKLCKDCTHYKDYGLGWDRCHHPVNGFNPVNGAVYDTACLTQRSATPYRLDRRCGPQGFWFEPKPAPAWVRFIKRIRSWIK